MDLLMVVIAKKNPDVAEIYNNSRNIIDRHGKTHENKIAEGVGTVYTTASATYDGSLLENATTTLIHNGEVVETIYTDEVGEATFDNVKAGTYIIEISQDTYNPKQSNEFIVQPGDELTIDLALDASNE